FFRSFLMGIKADVTSLYGILLVVFFIIHTTWIPEAIGAYIQGETLDDNWQKILFHFEALFLPFLILALMYQEPSKEVDRSVRKVLISAISLLPRRVSPIESANDLSDSERRDLEKIKTTGNWSRWNPIRQALDAFPNIETVILLGSPQTKSQHDLIKADPTYQDYTLKNLISNYTSATKQQKIKHLDIQIMDDFNEIETVYEKIKLDILNASLLKLDDYRDENIVFAVTGGTAIVSAAMTMHGVKGLRGIVYTRQDNYELAEFNLSIFNFNELLSELIERVSYDEK
ncbi:MAG: hypothetical protein AAGJ18_25405, partial [Bacteroidota bacterium]